MSDLDQVLRSAAGGDAGAAEKLLALVYADLRQLAAAKMSREPPGQTLQPTALVHEAWLRLQAGRNPAWENRRHFFAAAAETMRRILIERARRRKVLARGGYAEREDELDSRLMAPTPDEEIIAVNDALEALGLVDAEAAELVKLRYFAGLTMPEAAETMGISLRNAQRLWTFARAWLRNALEKS